MNIDDLNHTGVVGMKWGTRRGSNKKSTRSKSLLKNKRLSPQQVMDGKLIVAQLLVRVATMSAIIFISSIV